MHLCRINKQRGDGRDKNGDGHWEGGAYLCFTGTEECHSNPKHGTAAVIKEEINSVPVKPGHEALRLSRHKVREVPSGPKGAA